MFKRDFIVSITVLSILIAASGVYIYLSSSESQSAYQSLMNAHFQNKKERSEDEGHPTRQARQHVSKQILYKKGKDRVQYRLASEISNLVYSKKEGELVEQFKNVTCTTQEQLIDSEENHGPVRQSIRQFKANKAIYSYKTGQLEAKDAEIFDYLLPGDILPLSFEDASPILQGKARTVHISLLKEPAMKAEGFHAIFRTKEEE